MNKKTIFATIISFTILAIILLSTKTFANEEIVGGVTGEAINGTTNVARDVANSVTGTTESAINGVTNVVENITNDVREGINDMDNEVNDALEGNLNNEYHATTAGTIDANTFLGMNTTTWWWLIIAVVVILAVILIWHY